MTLETIEDLLEPVEVLDETNFSPDNLLPVSSVEALYGLVQADGDEFDSLLYKIGRRQHFIFDFMPGLCVNCETSVKRLQADKKSSEEQELGIVGITHLSQISHSILSDQSSCFLQQQDVKLMVWSIIFILTA